MEGRHPAAGGQRFRHEALFYEGADEFLAGTLPFIREGVAAGEPILAALDERKIGLLRSELGPERDRVRFVDMAALGRNPACIIPAWSEFVDGRPGDRAIRGIGEPAWPGRTAPELSECDRHESLLNLAFSEAPDFILLCPYDTAGLDRDTLAAARRNHPLVTEGGELGESEEYLGPAAAPDPFAGVLDPPPVDPDELTFAGRGLGGVRRFVRGHAHEVGLEATRQADLVLAVTELGANTIRHGGGAGTVRIWRDNGALVCEVADAGRRFEDPLTGRRRREPSETSGRGLWMVNQLCDLVQMRSGPEGNVVRVRVDLN